MLNNTRPENRTGHKIEPLNGGPIMEVIAKIEGHEVYAVQNYFKSDPTVKGGAYFVTAPQLEEMIKGYETGNWSYEL